MPFEWDENKARSNQAKHGVSFDEVQLAFDDPHALLALDQRHSVGGEQRTWLIGESRARLYVVIFTERRPDRYRIISARRAGRRDRRKYAANKRDTLSVAPRPAGDA